jgi:hypothetical protein
LFDLFSKYIIKILLQDFNAKLGRDDIFKPTMGMRVYMRIVMNDVKSKKLCHSINLDVKEPNVPTLKHSRIHLFLI